MEERDGSRDTGLKLKAMRGRAGEKLDRGNDQSGGLQSWVSLVFNAEQLGVLLGQGGRALLFKSEQSLCAKYYLSYFLHVAVIITP